MKIVFENENGIYSAEEKLNNGSDLQDVLNLMERVLMAASFSIKPGSLTIEEEEK